MKNYIIHDADGNILSSGTCQDEVFDLLPSENEFIIEGFCIEPNKRIVNGEIVDREDSEEEISQSDLKYKALAKLRYFRDIELKDSDWTQMPDNSLTDEKRQEWANYRQQLRDLPSNNLDITDVEDVIFPEMPR